MTFIIATNNPKKRLEIEKILNPLGIDAITAKEAGFDLSDVEETGKTFEENAALKAEAAFQLSGMPAISDDSGLVVDILNGEPGIYSARYAGVDTTDEKNIQKLLTKLEHVPEKKRTARFVTAICCILPDGEKLFVRGQCEGKIGFKKQGTGGFGYDPVFLIENGRSFAELSIEEKNQISHRGKALRLLEKELKKKLG